MNRAIILYVEDNPQNANLLMKRLRDENILVLLAETGREGIEMAHSHYPDLILMDFNLPDINGAEAIKHIRRYHELRQTPIVMLTADITPETYALAVDAGCDGYLLKPVERQDLLDTLGQFIRI